MPEKAEGTGAASRAGTDQSRERGYVKDSERPFQVLWAI
jgi:hypothetical protein